VPAVRFTGVSKRFELTHSRSRSVLSLLLAAFGNAGMDVEEFWALRDVSFEVEPGETLGIIGRNGSGKSTILKLLSGTLRADTGRIEAAGSVFGLLELGAGFHPDLTGRENVFLNGSFLGIHREEMGRLYPEIVAFAELERFMDTPIKHYSSGMYMRLGFAIALAVNPDILLIDEVLAVGDAAFARKCYDALADVKRSKRTMLFVSHDPIQVRRFCDRVLWLEEGRVRSLGPARDVIQEYLQSSQAPIAAVEHRAATDPAEEGAGPVQIVQAALVDENGRETHAALPGETVTLRVRYATEEYQDAVIFGAALRRSDGLYVHETSTAEAQGPVSVQPGTGLVECRLGPLPLGPGVYHLSLAVWGEGERAKPWHLLRNNLALFMGKPSGTHRGTTVIPHTWRVAAADGGELAQVDEATAPQPDMTTAALSVPWSMPPEALNMGRREEEYLGDGWHPVENWPPAVRWIGRRARVVLTQDVARGTLIISACRPMHAERPVRGTVTVDGKPITNFKISGIDFEDVVIPLEPVNQPTRLEIGLELAETFVPAVAGIDPDTRELGLAIREIRIE
jgi:ABC-type polysaccharide/polyol phosphate transport system ATPase subunit